MRLTKRGRVVAGIGISALIPFAMGFGLLAGVVVGTPITELLEALK